MTKNDEMINGHSASVKQPQQQQIAHDANGVPAGSSPSSAKKTKNKEKQQRRKQFLREEKQALKLHKAGKGDEVDQIALGYALRRKQRLKEERQEIRAEIKKQRREQGKKRAERRREALRVKRLAQKLKPSKRQILFAAPGDGDGDGDDEEEDDDDALEEEGKGWMHDMLAMTLPKVRTDMHERDIHDYLQWLTKHSQQLVAMLSQLVHYENEEDDIMNEMIRLKHVPMAKRYVEMTLWKRCKDATDKALQAVEKIGYGAGSDADEDTDENGKKMKMKKKKNSVLLVHDEQSNDVKFRSFRDKYMTNLLTQHETDLESIRLSEKMDEDQVTFLRRCVDASAALYANISSWDDQHSAGTRRKHIT